MDWLQEMGTEILVSAIGVVLTALATKLGTLMGKFWKEKFRSSTAQEVAKVCVSAVEMMYRDLDGAEKLKKAISLSGQMLRDRGVGVSDEELRVFLESALAEWKGAFQDS